MSVERVDGLLASSAPAYTDTAAQERWFSLPALTAQGVTEDVIAQWADLNGARLVEWPRPLLSGEFRWQPKLAAGTYLVVPNLALKVP